MTVRALEFYSGIGGLHLALSRSQIDAQVVQAFDWDQIACQVYAANHGNVVTKIDISTLSSTTLSSFQSNLWLLSPACQPYTVLNPNAKGSQDPRALSFLHLVQNVLPELALSNEHPDRLLVENVAGFESSTTRVTLVSALRSIGYTTIELMLTPLQFGIPNSRLRYYLLAKKAPFSFQYLGAESENHIWRRIPSNDVPWTDPRLVSDEAEGSPSIVPEIREYLDDSTKAESSIPDKVLTKWGRLFDIVKPSSRRTCCFTRGYTQLVERAGSILQENENMDTTVTFDAFLEAQARRDTDAVKILYPLRLRYFTPSELLRIFAFARRPSDTSIPCDSTFIWPKTVTTKTKYKFIGNSVNVEVVEKLIQYLFCDKE